MYGVPSEDNKSVEVYYKEDGNPVLVAIAPVEDGELNLDADEYCALAFNVTKEGKDILAREMGYKDASECDKDETYYPYLEKLTIPKGVVEFHCCDHGITELIIPEGVKIAYFNDNCIESVKLPSTLLQVECAGNPGSESFEFPDSCTYIYVGYRDPRNIINGSPIERSDAGESDMYERIVALASTISGPPAGSLALPPTLPVGRLSFSISYDESSSSDEDSELDNSSSDDEIAGRCKYVFVKGARAGSRCGAPSTNQGYCIMCSRKKRR